MARARKKVSPVATQSEAMAEPATPNPGQPAMPSVRMPDSGTYVIDASKPNRAGVAVSPLPRNSAERNALAQIDMAPMNNTWLKESARSGAAPLPPSSPNSHGAQAQSSKVKVAAKTAARIRECTTIASASSG